MVNEKSLPKSVFIRVYPWLMTASSDSNCGIWIKGEGKNTKSRFFGEMASETGHFVENSPPFVNLTQKSSIWAVCSLI